MPNNNQSLENVPLTREYLETLSFQEIEELNYKIFIQKGYFESLVELIKNEKLGAYVKEQQEKTKKRMEELEALKQELEALNPKVSIDDYNLDNIDIELLDPSLQEKIKELQLKVKEEKKELYKKPPDNRGYIVVGGDIINKKFNRDFLIISIEISKLLQSPNSNSGISVKNIFKPSAAPQSQQIRPAPPPFKPKKTLFRKLGQYIGISPSITMKEYSNYANEVSRWRGKGGSYTKKSKRKSNKRKSNKRKTNKSK